MAANDEQGGEGAQLAQWLKEAGAVDEDSDDSFNWEVQLQISSLGSAGILLPQPPPAKRKTLSATRNTTERSVNCRTS